ncbi:MAG: 30S ribosomal protein S10 [Nitrospirae bacterium]|nr:30S ribosomal protein S10 [Nitrospirota bacterium]
MELTRDRIILKSFDHRLLDRAVKEVVDTLDRTGAKIAGPVPLPTRISRFCVLRSPHVNKKSREHFEIRTHKRVIYILEGTPMAGEALSKLELPAGVSASIKKG